VGFIRKSRCETLKSTHRETHTIKMISNSPGDMRLVCTGARSTGDQGCDVEADPKRRCLRHVVSNLVLDAGKESGTFGEEMVFESVLIGLR
jgi:hypothetical protein